MRLTKVIKEEILIAAVETKFKKELTTAEDSLAKFLKSLLPKVYPKEIQDWIDKAPEGGLHVMNNVHFGSKNQSGNFITVKNFRFSEIKYELAKDQYRSIQYEFTITEKEKYIVLNSAINKIKEQQNVFENTVKTALSSCNTVKQLHDKYPELHAYVEKNIPEATQALAISESKVNAVLKMKVPSKEGG